MLKGCLSSSMSDFATHDQLEKTIAKQKIQEKWGSWSFWGAFPSGSLGTGVKFQVTFRNSFVFKIQFSGYSTNESITLMGFDAAPVMSLNLS